MARSNRQAEQAKGVAPETGPPPPALRPAVLDPGEYLGIREVAAIVGLHPATIRRYIADPGNGFPRPVVFGGAGARGVATQAYRWAKSDLAAYLAQLPRSSDLAPPTARCSGADGPPLPAPRPVVLEPGEYLGVRAVAAIVGLHPATIRRYIADPRSDFPRPVVFGGAGARGVTTQTYRFLRSELEAYVAQLPRSSDLALPPPVHAEAGA